MDVADAPAHLDFRRVPEPSVSQVYLQQRRLIGKTVAVHIVSAEIAVHVTKQDRVQVVSHLQGGSDIEVSLGVIHHRCVQIQGPAVRRLVIFQIDRTGNGLRTVDNGRRTLSYLDALQPRSGGIRKSVWRRDATHCGAVLVKHLGIYAGKAKKPDLPCAGGCVGIAHGYAGGILKAFRQGTAGHLHHSGRGDDLRPELLSLG